MRIKQTKRAFEVAKGFEDKEINLPQRSTRYSAGYDFEAAEDITVGPYHPGMKSTLIPTGIKACFGEDEVLKIYNRSSNPNKKHLVLANGVGIIDSDYYENEDNDGHIMFAFYNNSDEAVVIKKGDKIGQGIFQKYLLTNDDGAQSIRTGGFGSTGN